MPSMFMENTRYGRYDLSLPFAPDRFGQRAGNFFDGLFRDARSDDLIFLDRQHRPY